MRVPSMEGLKIPFLISYLFSILTISCAVDTITKTQFITEGKTIVSSGESFEMGFFSPGNSKNRYVGIWYKKISNRTVVWVANREIPLTDKSGALHLIDRGILVLLNSTNHTIWSTNASRSAQNPVVQLLDSGNLVVKDANDDNPVNFLWQSFDYPCDTLLPGMKLGKNFVTGLERRISSWKSDDDPAPGDFTYRCDPQGYPQNILSKGSTETYRTGPWNGLRFSGTPNRLKPNPIYTIELVFTEEEVYFDYHLLNSSVVSRFAMSTSGFMERWTWIDRTQVWFPYLKVPTDTCDTYKLCGPHGSCNIGNLPLCSCLNKFVPKFPRNWENGDWSSGCVRKTPLNCSNSANGFVQYSGYKLPDTRYSRFDRNMTLKECEIECLKNCSCSAYTSLDIRGGGSGCLLWFQDLNDMREISDKDQVIYIRMASSELGIDHCVEDSTDQKVGFNGKKRKIVLVSLALLIGLGLTLSLTLYLRNKRKKNLQLKREENVRHNSEPDYTDNSQNEDLELPLFDFAIIANSTNNFSMDNKLGEGGFGPVYKGILEGGQEIAVKRLSKSSSQGLEEFKNEVNCIAKLQHRNLVKLLGCCIQGEEKMLIYEYMPNKSLDYFIFDITRSTLLDWPKRFHIINGIARGLLYLHQDSRLRIIHRDLKASNILLDINMNPKISDFGLARCFKGDEIEANTNRVIGTYAYMSPEYALDGLFSIKSDVFSFGVLVLEIVSGKRNKGLYNLNRINLLGHAWRLYKGGKSLELIDEPLRDSCCISEVLRAIHVSLLCVQECPEDRPSMSSVVQMLGSEGLLLLPKQPAFFTEMNLREVGSSSSKDATTSGNEMTNSTLSAR